MNAIDDSINITGIANLLEINDIDIDIDELEQKILKTNFVHEPDDFDEIKRNINDVEYTPTLAPSVTYNQNNQNNQNNTSFYNPPQAQQGYAPTHYAPTHYSASVVEEYEAFNDDILTTEQKKHHIVDNAMPNFINSNFDFKEEDEKDKKMSMLEQIDSLIEILEDEKINTKSVQKVDINSSLEDIEAVLKWLTMKNDRNRFGTLGEEIILMGCKLLEKVFDGKKVYFGSRPDLTGWSATARTKLVRSRYHTSMIVSEIINEKNITPTTRLVLELVPNAMLYASRKKMDTTFDNAAYEDAMNNLNS